MHAHLTDRQRWMALLLLGVGSGIALPPCCWPPWAAH